jgi:hypothetical protein
MLYSNQSMIRALTLAGNVLSKEIIRITSGPEYAHEIPEGIELGTANVTDTGGNISIFTVNRGTIGKEDNNVLITLAFELGAEPHPIRPKGLGYPLKIPRERWPKYNPPPDTDPLFFMVVHHPGMKPKPFLMRALENVADRILEILGSTVKFTILDGPVVEKI